MTGLISLFTFFALSTLPLLSVVFLFIQKEENMAEDYRKKFKQHYGIEFGNEFHVHHIDLDRTNNDIENLMVLPKKLHSLYHFLLAGMDRDKLQITIDAKIQSSIINGDRYGLENAKNLIEALMECNKWYDYKLYLNGELPNIHGLEVY